MRWPTARPLPGSTSTCSASMISRRKSCEIVSESGPKIGGLNEADFWERQRGHNSKVSKALAKILLRTWDIGTLCWNLTTIALLETPTRFSRVWSIATTAIGIVTLGVTTNLFFDSFHRPTNADAAAGIVTIRAELAAVEKKLDAMVGNTS